MNRQPAGEPLRNAPIFVNSTHDRDVMAVGQRRFSAVETASMNPIEDDARFCGSEHAGRQRGVSALQTAAIGYDYP